MADVTEATVTELTFTPTEVDDHADQFVFVGTACTNLDHEFDRDIVTELLNEPGTIAQHAAWEFCGYITHADGAWIEWVMRHHAVVGKYASVDLDALVAYVNETWGSI